MSTDDAQDIPSRPTRRQPGRSPTCGHDSVKTRQRHAQYVHDGVERWQPFVEMDNVDAIIAVVDACYSQNVPLPDWVHRPFSRLFLRQLANPASKRRGPGGGNPIAALRRRAIQSMQWETVAEVREKQSEIRREVEDLRQDPGVPAALLQERETLLQSIGHTWEDAYRVASLLLQGTPAWGGEGTVKTSYAKVQKASKTTAGSLPWRIPSRQLQRIFALTEICEPNRVKNFAELYASEP